MLKDFADLSSVLGLIIILSTILFLLINIVKRILCKNKIEGEVFDYYVQSRKYFCPRAKFWINNRQYNSEKSFSWIVNRKSKKEYIITPKTKEWGNVLFVKRGAVASWLELAMMIWPRKTKITICYWDKFPGLNYVDRICIWTFPMTLSLLFGWLLLIIGVACR